MIHMCGRINSITRHFHKFLNQVMIAQLNYNLISFIHIRAGQAQTFNNNRISTANLKRQEMNHKNQIK